MVRFIYKYRIKMSISFPATTLSDTHKTCGLGLLLLITIALLALALAHWTLLPDWRPGPLFWAIVLGMLLTNLPRPAPEALASGYSPAGFERSLALARGPVLRLGVVLMGFQITVQDIQALGWHSVVLAAGMLVSTLMVMMWLGRRVFRLDKPLVLLIAAGSAICGAAAVLAVSQVSRAQTAHIAVATATVVIFGTVAMFVYPLLYSSLGMNAQTYGLFVGATVHEVAQVMVAGDMVSPEAAHTALITKLQRVLMLAPLLLILAFGVLGARQPGPAEQGTGDATARRSALRNGFQRMPWFALWFLAAVGLHSTGWLQDWLLTALVMLGIALLTVAMVAVGFCTRWQAISAAGWRPMLLAGTGAIYLVVGGYIATRLITAI